jgi:hypothetical protein
MKRGGAVDGKNNRRKAPKRRENTTARKRGRVNMVAEGELEVIDDREGGKHHDIEGCCRFGFQTPS